MTNFLVLKHKAPLGEKNLPIMFTRANELQCLCTRVTHIRTNVEKIFEEPKAAEGYGGHFPLPEKIERTQKGHNQFT
jgi:hypothetical protein